MRIACPNCKRLLMIEVGEYPYSWQVVKCPNCEKMFPFNPDDNDIEIPSERLEILYD